MATSLPEAWGNAHEREKQKSKNATKRLQEKGLKRTVMADAISSAILVTCP
jgi:hypothetical protein